jgi:hypothetical protein
MVYNTQNYRVFGLLPSPCILENRKHDVSETGFVSVLRWREEKTPTQLGPLKRANLNPVILWLIIVNFDVNCVLGLLYRVAVGDIAHTTRRENTRT